MVVSFSKGWARSIIAARKQETQIEAVDAGLAALAASSEQITTTHALGATAARSDSTYGEEGRQLFR